MGLMGPGFAGPTHSWSIIATTNLSWETYLWQSLILIFAGEVKLSSWKWEGTANSSEWGLNSTWKPSSLSTSLFHRLSFYQTNLIMFLDLLKNSATTEGRVVVLPGPWDQGVSPTILFKRAVVLNLWYLFLLLVTLPSWLPLTYVSPSLDTFDYSTYSESFITTNPP